MSPIPAQRTCNVCHQVKVLDQDFYRRTHRGVAGHAHTCKDCSRAHSRRQWASRKAARLAGPLVQRRLLHKGAIMLAKTCPSCHQLRQRDDFHRSAQRAGGLEVTCKACRSGRRDLMTPQQRADERQRSTRSREASGRLADHARRARKAQAPADHFTRVQLWDLYAERELYGCAYCGGPYEHDDHAIPLARGGAHALGNLVPACAACNMEKHTRTPLEYMRQRRSR